MVLPATTRKIREDALANRPLLQSGGQPVIEFKVTFELTRAGMTDTLAMLADNLWDHPSNTAFTREQIAGIIRDHLMQHGLFGGGGFDSLMPSYDARKRWAQQTIDRLFPEVAVKPVTVYHYTSESARAAILADQRWLSKEADGWVYVTSHRGGQAQGYGPAVVALAVPDDVLELDDEFPDGEQHFRIHVGTLHTLMRSGKATVT